MKIMILGSGGREHALAWKIKQSIYCDELYVAPGNGGTAAIAQNVPINANDFDALYHFISEKRVDLLIVGPEEPLVLGAYDYFTEKGITIFGPSAAGAQLEGSKSFSKKFMQKYNIPTASYAEFTADNQEEAREYIRNHRLPLVMKADGLAAGKGVIICENHEEALFALENMIVNRQFGAAGEKVVIEEFLKGIEISVFVITDGKDYRIIGEAKDYKRIGEGDTGLNTGGMGCVSPVPFADEAFMRKVEERIIKPTIYGLQQEPLTYHGFLFFGLMNVDGDPYVIEYNCRMGDPEAEVILPRLTTDLGDILWKTCTGKLNDVEIGFSQKVACTVVAVSGGYPGDYSKGKVITLPHSVPGSVIIFHAGTMEGPYERLLTNGGRVLTVTALAPNLQQAVGKANEVQEQISFEGKYYRKDIGWEFM